RRGAASPGRGASVADRDDAAVAMCRNQDRGARLHDLVGILWCGQCFEGTCRRIEGENSSGVAVLSRPFGGDQQRVMSSWREPEGKHRLRKAHPVVIA